MDEMHPAFLTRTRCCNAPDIRRAWTPRKPFGRSWYCENCGCLYADMGRFESWLWERIIGPFWNGQVQVEDEKAA